jgi:hypothetical protein
MTLVGYTLTYEDETRGQCYKTFHTLNFSIY